MAIYVVRRLLIAVLLVYVVATLVFLMLHFVPGDVALIILGSEAGADPAAVAALRAKLGLDRPLQAQYVRWLGGLLRRDIGRSLVTDQPVSEILMSRFLRSLELVIASLLLSVTVGIPVGVLSAVRRESFWDYGVTTLGLAGFSAPVFVVGLLLALLFSIELKWLPPGGYVSFTQSPVEHLSRVILPTVTLTLPNAAIAMRMTRSCLLEVLVQDYVRTARSKGLHEQVVIYRHALRNALIPVVAIVGTQLGTMLGGSVLVESVFNYPGLSHMLVVATARRDAPVIQGILMLIAIAFVLINLAVDLTYAALDPRIRYQ